MKEALRKLDGLFVGQLREDEMELFEYGIRKSWCYRSYEGVAGFMGLAKVRMAS